MWRLIQNRIGWVMLTLGASLLSIGASLWWNSRLAIFINQLNEKAFFSPALILSAVAAIFAVSVFTGLFTLLSGITCENFIHDLRMGYAGYIVSDKAGEQGPRNRGELLSGMINELSEISAYLNANLFPLAEDLLRSILYLTWLFSLDSSLTLVAHLPIPLLLIYSVITSKTISKAVNGGQQANAGINAHADTFIRLFPLLKIFDALPLVMKGYRKQLNGWTAMSRAEEATRARLMSLSAVFSFLPLLLLFLYGGYRVIQGEMAFGTWYLFINLSGNVSGVFMNLPGRLTSFRGFAANLKRIENAVLLEKGRC